MSPPLFRSGFELREVSVCLHDLGYSMGPSPKANDTELILDSSPNAKI